MLYLSLDTSTRNVFDYNARLILKLRMHELGFFAVGFFAASRKNKIKLQRMQQRILQRIGGSTIEDLAEEERKSLGNRDIGSYTLAR